VAAPTSLSTTHALVTRRAVLNTRRDYARRADQLPCVASSKLMNVMIESRLQTLGLTLPAPAALPSGLEIPFAWVRAHRDQAFVSGHGPLNSDGSPAGPFGKVPTEVTLEDAQQSALLATLAMLASLKIALGDLDRVTAWLTIDGHINAEPGYPHTTAVINPASELIVELYGPDAGRHARTAIGAPALPLNLPVVLAAQVEIAAARTE
jgi:enamine deaminase RidA (YjgF/YER057c/UK114 family)